MSAERGLAGPLPALVPLGLWLLGGLALAAAFALAAPGGLAEAAALALPLAAVLGAQCVSARYVVAAVPLGSGRSGRTIATALAAAAASGLLWLVLGAGWARLLAGAGLFPGAPERFAAGAALFFSVGGLCYLLAVAWLHLAAAGERTRAAERQALEADLLAREAELKALKAQLDPHFLFNSLNSVSALIGSDPKAARRMCLLLAGFFRKSLGLGRQREIPLSEELYLAETYLAIEQVRFGERLQVAMAIDEETLTLAVPPLLLQPLVENAVHHGIAQLIEGGEIRIAARRAGAELELEVENPCDPERPPSRGTGLGLGNARARLAALFGEEGRLEVRAAPESYRVRVALPARPAAGS